MGLNLSADVQHSVGHAVGRADSTQRIKAAICPEVAAAGTAGTSGGGRTLSCLCLRSRCEVSGRLRVQMGWPRPNSHGDGVVGLRIPSLPPVNRGRCTLPFAIVHPCNRHVPCSMHGGELFDRILSRAEEDAPFTEQGGCLLFLAKALDADGGSAVLLFFSVFAGQTRLAEHLGAAAPAIPPVVLIRRATEARDVVRNLVVAVDALHTLGITHRDLKPENFLYETKEADAPLKIADFGYAKVGNSGIFTTPVYTPYYVAPEVLTTKRKETDGYNKACDNWSLGVMAYMVLSGRPPFFNSEFLGDMTPGMSSRIRAGQYDFDGEEWVGISSMAKDFVRRLLMPDPSSRLAASDALLHPWIGSDLPDGPNGHLHTPTRLSSDPVGWQQAQVRVELWRSFFLSHLSFRSEVGRQSILLINLPLSLPMVE